MEFSYRKNDWCHICGKRKDKLCDVMFSNNDEDSTEYMRICSECVNLISRTIKRGGL